MEVRENKTGWEVDFGNLIFHVCSADKVNHDVPTSLWTWTKVVVASDLDKRIIDTIRQKGLESIRDAGIEKVSEWAGEILEKAALMEKLLKENGCKEFEVKTSNGESIAVDPCFYGTEANLSEIEYFLTDDILIGGHESLYKLAEAVVNYEELIRAHENSEIKLQKYYEEKVRPISNKPYEDRTEDEQQIMSHFSDWHKEVYGHRPRLGQNECEKLADAKNPPEEDMER